MNRTGNLHSQWAELVTFAFLLFGLILSLISGSKIITWFIILLCGVVVGRNYFIRQHSVSMPFYIIVIGFLLGFILGAWIQNRSTALPILFFFGIGAWAGHYICKKGYI